MCFIGPIEYTRVSFRFALTHPNVLFTTFKNGINLANFSGKYATDSVSPTLSPASTINRD